MLYPSVEHAFQASKRPVFDNTYRERVACAATPAMAKALGRSCQSLRPDWEGVKDQIMFDLVMIKFSRDKKLGGLLRQTSNATLVEGNNWGDTYWGVCNGVGKNMLGQILMTVRSEL